ncbi:hypothetical protein [Streptomyces sp. Act143]|uniref:hypothetical protein n=1 Tax=Streptomyces sp. Act143 TaxID=2200760 RepID=UPI00215AFC20|nr:hypothetical protein [Streptomyces sp. Act143]
MAFSGIQVRATGNVDAEALGYVRAKIAAAFERPGLPDVSGEVRVTHATAQHVAQPWSAAAEIRVGDALVVVHAQEASAHELADRLQDRLRGRVDRAAHRGDETRKTATPPPWRGGPGTDSDV